MKKTTALGLTVLIASFLASCAPQASIKAGSASAEALIRLLPKATAGVMVIDVHRAVGTASAAKALENPQAKQKYDEFVKMTGIDPMKDVYFVVIGPTGTPNAMEQEGGIIINLKYNKDALLTLLKEKAPEFKEEPYNGVTVYSSLGGAETKQTTRAAFLDDSNILVRSDKAVKTTRAAFLDDSNILVGSDKGVKGIIDVYQKKADSVVKNADMAGILKSVDKTAIAWGAFALPPGLVKKGAEAMPQLKVLEGVTALTISFDERLSKYIADIRTMGGTEEQNKNLASTLTGLKGLGGMLAAQEPAFGEFLNAIEISSGKDFTRLYISLSLEVLDKLGKAAQARVGDLVKIKKDELLEEKK